MKLVRPLRFAALTAVLALAGACAPSGDSSMQESAADEASETMPAESEMMDSGTVTILAPTAGAEVDGPTVTVRLEVSGVEIATAGDMREGTGHHHLYLDADLTDASEPVPTVPGSIVHMGDGSSEYVFEDVAPGEHRLIAVVADGAHVPLQPWVVDTVTFTVR